MKNFFASMCSIYFGQKKKHLPGTTGSQLKPKEISTNPPHSFDEKNDIVICDLVSNAAKRLQNMWDNILQLYNKVIHLLSSLIL